MTCPECTLGIEDSLALCPTSSVVYSASTAANRLLTRETTAPNWRRGRATGMTFRTRGNACASRRRSGGRWSSETLEPFETAPVSATGSLMGWIHSFCATMTMMGCRAGVAIPPLFVRVTPRRLNSSPGLQDAVGRPERLMSRQDEVVALARLQEDAPRGVKHLPRPCEGHIFRTSRVHSDVQRPGEAPIPRTCIVNDPGDPRAPL